jgi:hypothetical protein
MPSDGQFTNLEVVVNTTSLTKAGQNKIKISATDGSITKEATISVLVIDNNSAGGYHNAVYNQNLGVPMCFVESKQCSSGALLRGRGDVGPEKNAPNTLDDCMDGSLGTFNEDESLNKIIVRSGRLNGSGSNQWIREKEYITIKAYVYAYFPSDEADFWMTSTPSNPQWEYIGSLSATKYGKDLLEMEVRLSKGRTQAVRVSFHYSSNITEPCLLQPYDDVDDLGKSHCVDKTSSTYYNNN